MKTFKSILIILILIPVVVAVFQITEKKIPASENQNVVNDIDLSPNIKATQLCYIWNTEAGDKAMLSMDIRGEKVIGELYLFPFEKDSKTGIFKGSVTSLNSDINKWAVDVFWDAKAEGMLTQEQLWIILDKNIASPGFGEMKDRGDGVYIYANPDNISYNINLQQTDCGDNAMD